MGIWGSFKFSYRGGGREEARGMGGGGGGGIIQDVSVQL